MFKIVVKKTDLRSGKSSWVTIGGKTYLVSLGDDGSVHLRATAKSNGEMDGNIVDVTLSPEEISMIRHRLEKNR